MLECMRKIFIKQKNAVKHNFIQNFNRMLSTYAGVLSGMNEF